MRKTLYITKSGEFKRKDNTLFFETEEEKRIFVPVEDINDIFIFSEVTFNTKLLDFLSQKKICVHFFNYYGYYSGTYYPREHLNAGHVILKQSELYLDKDRRLDLAKRFVGGSISQMKQVLKYYVNRRIENNNQIKTVLEEISSNHDDYRNATNIEELMAVEGHVREKYYSCFDEIIQNKDFTFDKRSRRPPLNALNALISFGNSLCYTMVLSEIYKTHLDPRIGYLHSTNFRRFSLNLDVAEIFKPIMVDRLIFQLINKKMITKKHFEQEHGGGILLNENGRKIFLEQMEQKMRTTVNHRHLGKNVSYRRLYRLELYKIQKHVLGEKEYEPFVSRW
ncbi:type I-B CRISPR-associated endonuclease Cas1b [Neobacillus sp. OS1-32]|uniref:type I-B CRISPR-associated endonuclease Cas1b n=1 Tax=Neobacillus sp. OS1-32 TaxID=3070682 RepID=UPI0027E08C24|nr:type I-B CRISPR-associated endonuclease Cas1b [Neobacillus sp. OS1-32]WML28946.1 type I-B CRISPR-associated endonuclease Cas1b [Neobacillus sp. OS1-32]